MQVIERSGAARARRAQIIAATVSVIADEGYGNASFARIAHRAGLSSTRLISYHFAGKAELLAAVAANVIESIGAHVGPRVAEQPTSSGQLRSYLESVAGYIATHREGMKALLEIFLHGSMRYEAADDKAATGPLETILAQGQRAGEFREFDPRVLAAVIQRAIDGLPFLLESMPDLDCAAYAAELVTLFDLGLRA